MSNNVERADEEPLTHPTSVALSRPPAAEVDAGTDIVLKVKVSCPYGCDLRERVINVMAPDGAVVAGSRLAEFADHVNETTEFAFTAPDEVGEYSWTVVFPKQEAEGLVHEEGSLPITVRTLAHDTSLAVWGVPSPIVIDHPFRIQVGATCSAGCDLKGKEIEICDETGASIARGTLGETPWDGTRALYWTEVDLVAPAREGATSRSISVRTDRIAAAPRRGVGPIRIRDSQAAAVFGDGQGRRRRTPARLSRMPRCAWAFTSPIRTRPAWHRVAMPRGTYSLDVLKTGYEAPSRVLEVNGDVTVEVEVAVVPPENPDAYWLFDPTKRI